MHGCVYKKLHLKCSVGPGLRNLFAASAFFTIIIARVSWVYMYILCTVEPLYKDNPEMGTSPLIRTLHMAPAT